MGKLLISAINSSLAQEFQSTAQTQLVFWGVGLCFCYFAFCNVRVNREKKKLDSTHECQPWIRCTVQMKSNGVCRWREEKEEAERSRRGGAKSEMSALHPISSSEESPTLRGQGRGGGMSCSTGQKTFIGIITRALSNTIGYLILQSSLWPQPLDFWVWLKLAGSLYALMSHQ